MQLPRVRIEEQRAWSSAGSTHDTTCVVVVGAGPAGAVAATVLARAGARVCMLVDRAAFPRPKLCGDTLNPGALAILERLGLADGVERRGLRDRRHGGDRDRRRARRGDAIRAASHGRSILPHRVGHAARRTGASRPASSSLTARCVREPIVDDRAIAAGAGRADRQRRERRATCARRSRSPPTAAARALAFGLGLARHPPRAAALGDRRVLRRNVARDRRRAARCTSGPGHYIGVAPLPDGLTNVCLVEAGCQSRGHARSRSGPAGGARRRSRSAATGSPRAELVGAPVVLGPLAVDAVPARCRPTVCCWRATPRASSIR